MVAIALSPPLDELAERLLSAHMLQHLLLMLIAAPLLVWARPMPYLIWSLPTPFRRAASAVWNTGRLSTMVRCLRQPVPSWLCFCGTVLLWHVPAVYRWATESEVRHAVMHANFMISGCLFWSVVLQSGRRRHLDYASAAFFVFSAALVTGLPGALIAFARQPLFGDPTSARMPFGLTILRDQQLAGLLMWIPMDLLLFAVALVLLGAELVRTRFKSGGKMAVPHRVHFQLTQSQDEVSVNHSPSTEKG